MLKLQNHTQLTARIYPGYDQNNQHQLTCVIKAGYKFNSQGDLTLMQPSPAIEEIDRYSKSPGESTMIAANEIMPYKNHAEIIIYGTAYPSSNTISAAIYWPNNTIWHKQLSIIGARTWKKSIIGRRPSKPQPPSALPLNYEYALKTELNPIGSDLPQIIEPNAQKKIAGGFAPIPPAWRGHNTYNYAPDDQQFNNYFAGNEKIILQGFFAETESITLELPNINPTAQLNNQTIAANCDSLIINSNTKTLHMVWRARIPWEINDPRSGTLKISTFHQP